MVSAFFDVFYSLGQVLNVNLRIAESSTSSFSSSKLLYLGIVSTALLLHAKDLNQTSQNFSSMKLPWLYVSMSLIGSLLGHMLDYLMAIWWCWTKLHPQ